MVGKVAPQSSDAGRGEPSDAQPISILKLFLVCFRIGLFSFGGGLSGWIYQEIVVRRAWMSEDDFRSGLALSQVTPGVNVSNLVVYIGERLRGWPGSCAALTGLLLGPFFIVISLALLYERFSALPLLSVTLDGVAAAALGLLGFVGLRGVQHVRGQPAALMIIALIVLCVGVLQWPLVPVVLLMAPLSVGLAWMRLKDER